MPTLSRKAFVDAVKSVTSDPRLIETAETQEKFAIGRWTSTDEDGNPCGCVVGEFLLRHEAVEVPERVPGSPIEDYAYAVSEAGTKALNKVRHAVFGIDLQGIGMDIDTAVKNALREADQAPEGFGAYVTIID